jgi:hypothetical protein
MGTGEHTDDGSEPGVAIEGVLAIRHELDRVDLRHAELYIENGYHESDRLTDGYLPGELPDDDDGDVGDDHLVDEIVARVQRAHGRVVHVPEGTLAHAGAVLVVGENRPQSR